ncbi:hypothetical protein PoB_007593900 [Plakobranchus ocellatus]|uniref:Uncharacterized protein n=1 Tax=Plakobranchus ocellatus TaxID=259542 RepID=A0AAV4DYZ3_9GAST|nr:hypothetical protein PoB_007593900 [Plakobranchus ocellatus]
MLTAGSERNVRGVLKSMHLIVLVCDDKCMLADRLGRPEEARGGNRGLNLSPPSQPGKKPENTLKRNGFRQSKRKQERFGFFSVATPQQGDLRLSGFPSGQGVDGGARTRDRKVAADIRADSLATVLPTPAKGNKEEQIRT